MKTVLICVGNIRESSLKTLAEQFSSRIGHFMPFEDVSVADVSANKKMTPVQRCQKEGEQILSKIGAGDFVVLFDEKGREFTSREFAEFIEKKSLELNRNLVFVIGGPYGFSDAVYDRCDAKMSLSRMTFTHEMARVIALEQLYRAMTILRGLPYHHD